MTTDCSSNAGGDSLLARIICAIVAVMLLVFVTAVFGVVSYFRLSSEASALRDALLSSSSDTWHPKITLNIGGVTTGLARMGLRFVNLPPEARAAANAVRGVEVGVYELEDEQRHDNPSQVIARADKAMGAQGWMRAVGVIERDQLVAVYVPAKGLKAGRVKCCVLVVDKRELVVASVRADAKPLMELVTGRLHDKLDSVQFALR